MPTTVTVSQDGFTGDVQVPDGLSDTDAAAAAHEAFTSALQQHNAAAPAAPATPSGPDDTLWGAARAGAGGLVSGVGKALNVAGTGLEDVGLPTLGGYAHTVGDAGMALGNKITPPNLAPIDPVGKYQKGDYKGAAYDAARAGAEAAPYVGAAVINPYIGAGLAGAAAEGDTAYQRAANNGRATPTGTDALAALPTAAVSAGLGLLPGGKLADAVPTALGRSLARVGIDAATTAGLDTAQQVGGSVDTDKGLSVDPHEVANAAVGGAAAGSAIHGAGLASEATGALKDRAISSGYSPVDAADAQATLDANARMQQAATDVGNANGRSDQFAIANSAKSQAVRDLQSHLRALRDGGYITSDDAADMRAVIDQARRNNNSIGVSDPDSDFSTLLDKVSDKTPAELIDPFVSTARALDKLSTQSFKNRAATPLATAGALIGKYAGKAAGAGLGLETPGMGLAGAVLGMSPGGYVGSKIGGAIGGALDNAFGTGGKPAMTYQTMAAQRQYPDLTPANPAALQMATQQARAPSAQPDPQTGLPSSPIPPDTPIPAARPTPAAAPSPSNFRPDTPQNVRETIARDDRAAPPAAAQTASTPQPEGATGIPGGEPSPVWSGAHSYISNGRTDLTSGVIHAAVDRAVAEGALGPQTAEALKSGQMDRIAPGVAREVQSRLPADPRHADTVVDPTVRRPMAYQNATENYHAQADQLAAAAVANGHPEAVPAIRAVQHARGSTRAATHALKSAHAHAHVAKHGAHHAAYFPKSLTHHAQEH